MAFVSSACSKQARDECFVFIDNSNLLINAQKYFAARQGLSVRQDARMRVDVGKLVKYLIGNRRSSQPLARCYGSEQTLDDSLWHEVERNNIEVKIFKKNVQGKEKGLDATLAFDLATVAAENRIAGKCGTFIIASGDRDFLDCAKRLLQWGFKVEIVSWRMGLSTEFRSLEQFGSSFKVRCLDDEIAQSKSNICYYNKKWAMDTGSYPNGIPMNRTIAIEFAKEFAEVIADTATKKCHIPFSYCWSNESSTLFLVAMRPDGHDHFDFPFLFDRHKEDIRLCAEKHCGPVGAISIADDYFAKKNCPVDGQDNPSVREQLDGVAQSPSLRIFAAAVAPSPLTSGANSIMYADRISATCAFSFWCPDGKACTDKHTPNERRFFERITKAQDRRYYKTSQCPWPSKCAFRCDVSQCRYAHGIIDARCRICNMRGKHFRSDCPNR